MSILTFRGVFLPFFEVPGSDLGTNVKIRVKRSFSTLKQAAKKDRIAKSEIFQKNGGTSAKNRGNLSAGRRALVYSTSRNLQNVACKGTTDNKSERHSTLSFGETGLWIATLCAKKYLVQTPFRMTMVVSLFQCCLFSAYRVLSCS